MKGIMIRKQGSIKTFQRSLSAIYYTFCKLKTYFVAMAASIHRW